MFLKSCSAYIFVDIFDNPSIFDDDDNNNDDVVRAKGREMNKGWTGAK